MRSAQLHDITHVDFAFFGFYEVVRFKVFHFDEGQISMTPDIWEMFLLVFTAVAFCYSFLASCTALLYKSKSVGQLSRSELKVKQGTASLEVRVNLFVRTFFSCFFTYQIYLLALFIGGAVYLAIKYLPW